MNISPSISNRLQRILSVFSPSAHPALECCLYTGRTIPEVGVNLAPLVDFLTTAMESEALIHKAGHREDAITSTNVFRGLQEDLKKLGARFLAHGYFRASFRVGGWVVKCSLHSSLHGASKDELEFLKRLPEKYRKNFPDTYELAEGIILQRYYEVNSFIYCDEIVKIKALEKELGLFDIHEDNVGWDEQGNFVFIDFSTRIQLKELKEKRKKL